jgi:hypothetical protein
MLKYVPLNNTHFLTFYYGVPCHGRERGEREREKERERKREREREWEKREGKERRVGTSVSKSYKTFKKKM